MKKIELKKRDKDNAEILLSKFANYSKFSKDKDAAYKFTNLIGIKICPYCNIEYIYTVYDINKQPVFRPDIDHFIPKNPKTGNPKLQLELTNLIPSCAICNERLKRDTPFSQSNYLHPYFDDFDSIMKFHLDIKDVNYFNEDNFEICLYPTDSAKKNDIKKAKNNISIFKLIERYKFHKDSVVELFKRIYYYNTSKQNEIFGILNANNDNFKMQFPEKYADINRTSLGKLKQDILKLYL